MCNIRNLKKIKALENEYVRVCGEKNIKQIRKTIEEIYNEHGIYGITRGLFDFRISNETIDNTVV